MTPNGVDDLAGGDRTTEMHEQEGENGSLLGALEVERTLRPADLERAEDAELHTTMLRRSSNPLAFGQEGGTMNGRRTALVAAGLAAMIAGVATIAGAAVTAKNGRIAFVRLGLGTGVRSSEILVTNGDGTGEQRVTQAPAGYSDDLPSWSPDGSRIAFQRCASAGGACLVWSVSADGSGPQQLSPACQSPAACADDRSPVYSPDGRHIAFVRTKGRPRLMVAGAKLGRARAVAGLASFGASPYAVAWSPNAKQLVFSTVASDGRRAVYVAAANGTHAKRVTPWLLEAGGRPDWSPNGKRILFHSYSNRRGGFGVNLYTVRPDGTGLVQLTHFPDSERVLGGAYSPDGALVVFATTAGTSSAPDIVVVRADGTGVRPVTRSENWETSPDWGPQG